MADNSNMEKPSANLRATPTSNVNVATVDPTPTNVDPTPTSVDPSPLSVDPSTPTTTTNEENHTDSPTSFLRADIKDAFDTFNATLT